MGLRPERLQKLVRRHQPPLVLDEVTKHIKRLRGEVRPSVTMPQALVCGIKPE